MGGVSVNTPLYVAVVMNYADFGPQTGAIKRADLFPTGGTTLTPTAPKPITVTNPFCSKIIWTNLDLEGVSTNLTDTGTPSAGVLTDFLRLVGTFRNEGGIEGKVNVNDYVIYSTASNKSFGKTGENLPFSIPPGNEVKIFFDLENTYDFTSFLSSPFFSLTDTLNAWRNQTYTGYMYIRNSITSYSSPVKYTDLQVPTTTTTTTTTIKPLTLLPSSIMASPPYSGLYKSKPTGSYGQDGNPVDGSVSVWCRAKAGLTLGTIIKGEAGAGFQTGTLKALAGQTLTLQTNFRINKSSTSGRAIAMEICKVSATGGADTVIMKTPINWYASAITPTKGATSIKLYSSGTYYARVIFGVFSTSIIASQTSMLSGVISSISLSAK